VASRTFRTGRSTAIFVRKYAGALGWASWLFWIAVAFPVAFVREAARRNAASVLAKYRGFWTGLRSPLPPVPPA
jgi:hypothetical protein